MSDCHGVDLARLLTKYTGFDGYIASWKLYVVVSQRQFGVLWMNCRRLWTTHTNGHYWGSRKRSENLPTDYSSASRLPFAHFMSTSSPGFLPSDLTPGSCLNIMWIGGQMILERPCYLHVPVWSQLSTSTDHQSSNSHISR